MRMIIGLILTCACGASAGPAVAGEASDGDRVYQDTEAYVANAFGGRTPAVSTVWPDSDLREQLTDILGHRPGLRFRYWGEQARTVWILDEIGKDRPITAGVVVDDGHIEDVQVLVFRESRGWEVKHDFFTRQFAQLTLNRRHQLSGDIDNITGATLSVKAMTRMARAALLLHEHTRQRAALAHAR